MGEYFEILCKELGVAATAKFNKKLQRQFSIDASKMSDTSTPAHPFAKVIGRLYGIVTEFGKRPTRQLIDSFLQLSLFVNITHTHPS